MTAFFIVYKRVYDEKQDFDDEENYKHDDFKNGNEREVELEFYILS